MSTTHPTASDIDSSGTQVTTIRFKRSTAAIWESVNPILLSGEPAYETDTAKWKIGDGTSRYNDLPYKTSSGSGGSTAWVDITGKPTTFSPSAHTHPVSEITGFQSAVSSNTDVAAIKAIVGAGITDGDTIVNTLTEMLSVFSSYQEGVNIATTIANLQNKRVVGIAITGTTTKTITLTFSDNSTISNTFTDLNSGGGGGIVDTTIISGSANAVSGGAVFSALAALTSASVVNLTSSPTITWDYTAGKVAALSLAHNATLVITGANNGDSGYLLVTQNGGNKTLSLPDGTAFKINLENTTQTALGWIKMAGVFVWTGDLIVTTIGSGGATISGNVINVPTPSGGSSYNEHLAGKFQQDNLMPVLSPNFGNPRFGLWDWTPHRGTAAYTNVSGRGSVISFTGDGGSGAGDLYAGPVEYGGSMSFDQFKFISLAFALNGTLSNVEFQAGLTEDAGNNGNGVMVEKLEGDTQFYLKVKTGGTITRVASGITAVAGTFYDFRITYNSDGTASLYNVNFADGTTTLLCTNTAVSTETSLLFFFNLRTVSGVGQNAYYDYFNYLLQ